MVFSSIFFLYCFLPVMLLVYFITPQAYKNSLLLAASLVFYSWGEGLFVLLMLFSIALNYAFGLAVSQAQSISQRKRLVVLSVVFNLGLLALFKYGHFVVDNVNLVLVALGISAIELAPIHLPIGISFFTFQAMSYVIDVYRDEAPAQKNPIHVALYISLFPQLIAGPIVRYHDIAQQIVQRQVSSELFATGARRFIIGLSKKVLIANTLGYTADKIFTLDMAYVSTPLAWLGLLCYSLQLYFDFSAYSDMAIGLGQMLGFKFLENFNYPYIAQSIQAFWQRWHMSLSRWFRDYLYIPLGGNRCSPVRVYLNLMVVFFLCGLWHGASWNFVIWGMIHGMCLVLERLGWGRILARLWPPIRHLYVILVVMLAWVFFRAETLPHALVYVQTLFGFELDGLKYPLRIYLGRETIIMLCVAVIAATPIYPAMKLYLSRSTHPFITYVPYLSLLFYVLLLFICSAYLAAETYNPFIYFRF